MCDICTLTAPLPAATIDIVGRGVAAVINNALAGLALPSSTHFAMRDAEVEERMGIEWARSLLAVMDGEGEV